MFRQPQNLILKTKTGNVLGDSSLVMGVEFNGEVKAYPLRFIVYHHQVRDTVGGKPVMVTYCSVCRTGRVFEPRVGTEYETFRLVGMDHFNAMFEDASTKSWWRQVTGEAVAGPRKGESLPEIESFQLSVGQLFKLYPNALVMQPDESHEMQYDTLGKFEQGKSTGDLTRTDNLSWKEKSWVIGVQIGKKSKAYDWNLLTEQGIINDIVDDKPIVVAVTDDRQSFSVFERPGSEVEFSIRNDTLITKESLFDFSGQDLNDPYRSLDRVQAYQEFWHSWRTFHPYTDQFNEQQIVNNKQ
jgi:hypothetical protein